jgi:ABC-2 type transport system ATP-binding protein
MDVVVTRDLRKSYGAREVLHGIDLRVPAGSLYGFLGPNGAGKTTTIRILLGLLRASGGSATLLEGDAWRDGARLRADIGYVSGDVRLYDNATGRSTIRFFDSARGGGSTGEINRLAQAFDLARDLDRKVRSYSKGMKQKLALILALMHRPRLLIMDEPTSVVDPLVREVIYSELRNAAGEGRTVLFSSHTLSEVEQLCDRVAIVRDGYLVEQDRVETLRRRAVRRVEILFAGDSAPTEGVPQSFRVDHRDGPRQTGSWVGDVQPLLRWLAPLEVKELIITPPSLEDLFLAYYNKSTPQEPAA